MEFQLFRYILTPVQFTLGNNKELSKQDVMLQALSSKGDFFIKGREFAVRPQEQFGNDYKLVLIGKKSIREHDIKVEDNFVKEKIEEWPHRKVFFNTNDKNMQIAAFEISNVQLFGTPLTVLQGYGKFLNIELAKHGWHIEFEPIIDPEAFWQIVGAHKGKIKSLEFSYYVPNLFGTQTALEQELESAKTDFSAQKVDAKISNDDGNLVIPDNKFVQDSIDLIRKGGGTYAIRVKGFSKKFTSESKGKFIKIDEAEFVVEDKDAFILLLDKLLKLESA